MEHTEEEEIFWNHVLGKLDLYNGGQKCDVIFEGPCSCGAWHHRQEFIWRCNRYGQDIFKEVVEDCKKHGVLVPRGFFRPELSRLEILIQYGVTV